MSASMEIEAEPEQENSNLQKFGDYTLYQVMMFKYIAVEGIKLDVYSCGAGYKTFGIGCVADTREEEELIKSGLTYEKVRAHLEKEHLKNVRLIERDAPKKYTEQQKCALAMLFLSIGYDRFWTKNNRKARFWKGYTEGKGIPEEHWKSCCSFIAGGKIKFNGVWYNKGDVVYSPHLAESKRFEVNLYKGNIKSLLPQIERYKKTAISFQKRLGIWRS